MMLLDHTIYYLQQVQESGVLLHISYIILIFMLILDRRKQALIADKIIERNLNLGTQLDVMRLELKQIHLEFVQLIKENNTLSLEVHMLNKQIMELREELQKK